jgi:pilus assembly protein Flp/PilA
MEPARVPSIASYLPYRFAIAQEILSKTPASTREESPRFSFQNGIWDGAFAMRTIKRFLRDETAATAIEYGLIAAGISLAIIAIINGLGAKLNTKFTAINSSLK